MSAGRPESILVSPKKNSRCCVTHPPTLKACLSGSVFSSEFHPHPQNTLGVSVKRPESMLVSPNKTLGVAPPNALNIFSGSVFRLILHHIPRKTQTDITVSNIVHCRCKVETDTVIASVCMHVISCSSNGYRRKKHSVLHVYGHR